MSDDLKASDLDEVELEAALVSAGWEVEEIHMEPTVADAMMCTVDARGYPLGGAKEVKRPIMRVTVLVATKAGRQFASGYDRADPAPCRAVALLALVEATAAA